MNHVRTVARNFFQSVTFAMVGTVGIVTVSGYAVILAYWGSVRLFLFGA